MICVNGEGKYIHQFAHSDVWHSDKSKSIKAKKNRLQVILLNGLRIFKVIVDKQFVLEDIIFFLVLYN